MTASLFNLMQQNYKPVFYQRKIKTGVYLVRKFLTTFDYSRIFDTVGIEFAVGSVVSKMLKMNRVAATRCSWTSL